MNKKILLSIVILFNIVFLAKASQTLWIVCPGDYEVAFCTVGPDYFDSEEEYREYISDLGDIACNN